MSQQIINIPRITLDWSPWHGWSELHQDARSGGTSVPNRVPGVYQLRRKGTRVPIYIGKTSNLRSRVKQGLVRGKARHSGRRRIIAGETPAELLVRWAPTRRPAAAEEDLHIRHVARHGSLPLYVKQT